MAIGAQMKREFYIYLYMRKDGTPYYVGKGKGSRAFQRNHCSVTVPPKERVHFAARNMSEPDALQAEMFLIKLYGRKDIGTGCLRNLTDGGEGMSGHIPSEETRNKKRVSSSRWIRTKEHCASISRAKKGRTIISAACRLMSSLKWKGIPKSEETKRKMAKAYWANPESRIHRGTENGRAIIGPLEVAQIRSKEVNERQAKQLWGLSHSQFYRVKKGAQWANI